MVCVFGMCYVHRLEVIFAHLHEVSTKKEPIFKFDIWNGAFRIDFNISISVPLQDIFIILTWENVMLNAFLI